MYSDEQYMDQALVLAQQAFAIDEVPIGALIVNSQGRIIGSGFNRVESERCQLAHAELRALREATDAQGDWRLEGCTVYVTLEPCSMCYHALRLSRVKKIVFGADSPLFGFHLDKDSFISVYNLDAILTVQGVRKQECQELLKRFFQQKRGNGEIKKGSRED